MTEQIDRKRWAHEARSRDLDDFATVMEDAFGEMQLALSMLADLAKQESISLEGCDESAKVVSLLAERLRRAGLDYVAGIEAWLGGLRPEQIQQHADGVALARNGVGLIAMKAGRLSAGLELDTLRMMSGRRTAFPPSCSSSAFTTDADAALDRVHLAAGIPAGDCDNHAPREELRRM